MNDLISIVRHIVEDSNALKNQYTDLKEATVEFACVFCQSDDEYHRLTKEIESLGKKAQNTPTGFTYLLNQPLDTVAGPLSLVKIRKPDPLRKERGDADFNTNYNKLKNKYGNNSNFELVKRNDFEMLRLSESDGKVMTCFSNIPLSKLLNIDK